MTALPILGENDTTVEMEMMKTLKEKNEKPKKGRGEGVNEENLFEWLKRGKL